MKTTDNIKNLVLKSLTADEFQKIEKHLKKIELPVGKVLYYTAEKIEYVYFPETGVISIVTVLETGNTVESGIIGSEGFSGAAVIFHEEISPLEATIQLSGELYRLPVGEFKKLFEHHKNFRDAVLHHIYTFIAQISQNAACLCHHKIDQRLARWLLMFDDRAASEKLHLTQEFIAQMLGVHRPTVSKNANELQKKGFISYNRGTVKILDRAALENFTCECYKTINDYLKGHKKAREFEKRGDI
jgi:CRP-like cAMP-binding protein